MDDTLQTYEDTLATTPDFEFDYDTLPEIRWRGLESRRGGICCEVLDDGLVTCDGRSETECNQLCIDFPEDFVSCIFYPSETNCFHNPICGGGGCCFADGDCLQYIDEASCLAAGGSVFLGDGEVCPDEATCLCGIPAPNLNCDQISASSSSACPGIPSFDDSGNFYLTSSRTKWAETDTGTPCNQTVTTTFDPEDCTSSVNCTGDICDNGLGFTCNPCLDCGDIFGFCAVDTPCVVDSPTTGHCGEPPGDPGTCTFTLSDPFDPGDPCDAAIALLPAYDDDYNDTCRASRSDDGFTCAIERFKPRFFFSTASEDFTITYNEHLVPDMGSPSDVSRSIDVFIGETEVDGFEVFEPDENGIITIADITVTCTP